MPLFSIAHKAAAREAGMQADTQTDTSPVSQVY